ncbi:hypothetical protein V8C43DRAFT_293425 [Trichoderma afarasin]
MERKLLRLFCPYLLLPFLSLLTWSKFEFFVDHGQARIAQVSISWQNHRRLSCQLVDRCQGIRVCCIGSAKSGWPVISMRRILSCKQLSKLRRKKSSGSFSRLIKSQTRDVSIIFISRARLQQQTSQTALLFLFSAGLLTYLSISE